MTSKSTLWRWSENVLVLVAVIQTSESCVCVSVGERERALVNVPLPHPRATQLTGLTGTILVNSMMSLGNGDLELTLTRLTNGVKAKGLFNYRFDYYCLGIVLRMGGEVLL